MDFVHPEVPLDWDDVPDFVKIPMTDKYEAEVPDPVPGAMQTMVEQPEQFFVTADGLDDYYRNYWDSLPAQVCE